ncbi:MAG: hypothetical protein H6811_10815 [Phycisphaeraceae bacterium]|nr:hypothetical protein [Phycisphaeraceae bacterium]
MTSNAPARSARSRRRGAIVAAIVVLLALMNLVVVGVLRPTADESQLAEDRVQSSRAFHASESGARIAIRRILAGDDPLEAGTTVSVGVAEIEFIQSPESGEPGEIVIEGRSGDARRRLSVMVQ